ncbi:MAG: hypothetical protein COV34_02465 [Candidatus Zambryskibacteria bacterium CG10_big_fil_rev_8_21_14_0_10_42_12]|uniref:Conjugal transfer protein n=1 Tax=Candidatus Zambryskibacteria bacterium CG10_big_fil_rev_8_21_14_0_10_42_12 TaxID=1975115 RepID=A0A2H0QUG9_9BACT|nr:MAG: hypothetical protein COV34_02465 [Candidatus Zambryskibacteria bacterium CG10_big_fil_rev_8_21_14_0_10_42_12]
MKTKLATMLLAVSLLIPAGSLSAQELTRDQVVAVAPQFVSALGSMQVGLSQVRMQIISENMALKGISNVLSVSLNNLSSVKEPLSATDQVTINRVETNLSNVEAQVREVTVRRQNIQQILDNITNTLVGISEAIAEAV